MRWLVGDLHGCARELDALLREIRFDPSQDELWPVGDLVNTGAESLEVLRLWRDVDGKGVLGNHDIYALRSFSGSRSRRAGDTLDALFSADDGPELLDRLRSLPLLVQLADGSAGREVWVVHAGLHPRWTDLAGVAERLNAAPFDDDRLTGPWVSFATRVRCCTAEGRMSDSTGPPGSCRPPFRPWDDHFRGNALIVHGHWARRGFYRDHASMSLDSGCVYGGELTAWSLEEDRFVQIPKR